MRIDQSKKWLANNGYVYHSYMMSFIPPNTIVYIKDKKLAYLDDEEYGELVVDGVDISNNNTLDLFTRLIESKS